MPPQVPPRTYVSRFGNRKNLAPNKNRRISVDPVRSFSLPALEVGLGWSQGAGESWEPKNGMQMGARAPAALLPFLRSGLV